jgi:hypothetical protein
MDSTIKSLLSQKSQLDAEQQVQELQAKCEAIEKRESERRALPIDLGAAAPSGLGFFGRSVGELLAVRGGLAAAVCGTLYLDLTTSRHRA